MIGSQIPRWQRLHKILERCFLPTCSVFRWIVDLVFRGGAVDEPLDGSTESVLREELFNAIQDYEPRVIIRSIDFEYDTDEQRLTPIVDVSIKGSDDS